MNLINIFWNEIMIGVTTSDKRLSRLTAGFTFMNLFYKNLKTFLLYRSVLYLRPLINLQLHFLYQKKVRGFNFIIVGTVV